MKQSELQIEHTSLRIRPGAPKKSTQLSAAGSTEFIL